MAKSLKDLEAAREKLAEDQAAIEKQIREAKAAEASKHFDQVMALVETYGEHFSAGQVRRLTNALGGRPAKAAGGSMPFKYQLPSGEKWRGRGRRPPAFVEWEQSPEGKDFRKKHPNQPYPAYKGG